MFTLTPTDFDFERKIIHVMELLSRIMRKLSTQHINFTVPLSDWAASLCTEIIFNPRYPKKYRNNIHFSYYYHESFIQIISSISPGNQSLDEITGLSQE